MDSYLIGIDVGGTNIKMLIMDTSLRPLEKCSIPTNAPEGYEKISARMIQALDSMFANHNINEKKVVAIGMGLPGTVDRKNKKTLFLSRIMWNGFDPSRKFGDYYDAPTVIDNDANINALGECYFGALQENNLILLTLGTGVGGGIIIDGQIFGGNSNLGGEIGHMTVETTDGEICLCGRKGCLEAYCSGTAMEKTAQKMLSTHTNTVLHRYIAENNGIYDNSMVSRGVLAGDVLSIQIMNRFNHYLAIGCANLMKLFNPEVILIGGGLSNARDLIFVPVAQKCQELILSREQYCPIRKATLGAEAGMYGSCALAAMLAQIPLTHESLPVHTSPE